MRWGKFEILKTHNQVKPSISPKLWKMKMLSPPKIMYMCGPSAFYSYFFPLGTNSRSGRCARVCTTQTLLPLPHTECTNPPTETIGAHADWNLPVLMAVVLINPDTSLSFPWFLQDWRAGSNISFTGVLNSLCSLPAS